MVARTTSTFVLPSRCSAIDVDPSVAMGIGTSADGSSSLSLLAAVRKLVIGCCCACCCWVVAFPPPMMMIRCVKFWSSSIIIIVRKKSFFTHSKVLFFGRKTEGKTEGDFFVCFFSCVFFLCFFGLKILKTDRPLCETGLSLSRGVIESVVTGYHTPPLSFF